MLPFCGPRFILDTGDPTKHGLLHAEHIRFNLSTWQQQPISNTWQTDNIIFHINSGPGVRVFQAHLVELKTFPSKAQSCRPGQSAYLHLRHSLRGSAPVFFTTSLKYASAVLGIEPLGLVLVCTDGGLTGLVHSRAARAC